jgi:hypothetical protein
VEVPTPSAVRHPAAFEAEPAPRLVHSPTFVGSPGRRCEATARRERVGDGDPDSQRLTTPMRLPTAAGTPVRFIPQERKAEVPAPTV